MTQAGPRTLHLALSSPAQPRPSPCISWPGWQVIEELFTYWNLEDADQTLEELEDALIVRSVFGWDKGRGLAQPCQPCGLTRVAGRGLQHACVAGPG